MFLAADIIGVPWWVWLLAIIGLLVLLFFLRGNARPAASLTAAAGSPAAMPASIAHETGASAQPARDDLAVIEGIGPRIAEVLQAAGISTFAQLAAADTTRLSQVLEAADLRLADPETWPQQAGLAAEGRWDDLKVLQGELKGGRQV